jgi:hypothetical protein
MPVFLPLERTMTAPAPSPPWRTRPNLVPSSRVEAITATGKVSFVVADPPTVEDFRRWYRTARLPGLADAIWTAGPES